MPALVAAVAAVSFQSVTISEAEAKTPGKTYCFYKTCHRVKSIAETEAMVGKEETLVASHYDSCKKDRYNPCGLTSSGEVFDPEDDDNAASPIYPDGTALLVWSPETNAAVVLRVNNAGPYWGNRKLDVSRGAAERLGFAHKGVAKLKVRVLDAPSREEASYRRNRTYDPLPGYIGRFNSADTAHLALASVSGMETLAKAIGVQAKSEAMTVASTEPADSDRPVAVAAASASAGAKGDRKAESEPNADTRGTPVQAWVASHSPKPPILVTPERRAAKGDVKASVQAKAHRRVVTKHPTRAARVAMAKSRLNNRNRVATLARRARVAVEPRPIRAEGTNDMSVFSRHVTPGLSVTYNQRRVQRRLAAEARFRQTASLYRGRDRDDG